MMPTHSSSSLVGEGGEGGEWGEVPAYLQELFHDDEVHFADAGVVFHVGFGIFALDHQVPAQHQQQQL